MDPVIHRSDINRLVTVKLPNPRTKILCDYLYDEENLTINEVVKFSDAYKSWFLDDLFRKDGELFMITKIDPLFLFLPFLKKNSKNFRSLDDICTSATGDAEDKLDYALNPNIDWNLICDTQEVNNDLYIKISLEKTLSWLSKKHEQLTDALFRLKTPLDSGYSVERYAFGLICDYLEEDLANEFEKMISSKLSIHNTKHSGKQDTSVKRKSTQQPSKVNTKKVANNKSNQGQPNTGLFKYFSRKQ